MAPIVLYGTSPSPPFRAVLLTAKAVGVELKHQEVDLFGKQEHKTEAFLKMNPTHTVPTLDDNGFYMWESRAIMGYLVNQYGKDDKLYPKEAKKRAVVDNMLYFDADCLFVGIQQYFRPALFGKPLEDDKKEVALERMGFLNTILGQRPYAAGDHLTIADFSIISTMSLADVLHFNMDDFPNIKKWVARIKTEVTFYNEVTKEGIDKLEALVSSKLKK